MVLWGRQQRNDNGSSNGPVHILGTYAKTVDDVNLFAQDAEGGWLGRHLRLDEVLAAFPDGLITNPKFEYNGMQWQVQSRCAPGSTRAVHLAMGVSPAKGSDKRPNSTTASHQLALPYCERAGDCNRAGSPLLGGHAPDGCNGGSFSDAQCILAGASGCNSASRSRGQCSPSGAAASAAAANVRSFSGYGDLSSGNGCSFGGGDSCGSGGGGFGSFNGGGPAGPGGADGMGLAFLRHLLDASNKKESLERYKAIMALIDMCKRRARELAALAAAAASQGKACGAGGGGLDVDALAASVWGSEAGHSLLVAVVHVGEALAAFGNCPFPERSTEGRAILAGDYKRLLREFLGSLGGVFAPDGVPGASQDLQDQLRSVGSLLATRCEAYSLMFDQLVVHCGLESNGNTTLLFNHNTVTASPATNVTANPSNAATAAAASRAKAVNKGLGLAAAAAAGLVGAVALRVLLRRGGGGGRLPPAVAQHMQHGGSDSTQGTSASSQRRRQLARGRGGSELALVTTLTSCAEELRKAGGNEGLLRDDWRLGRGVRLAWPPAPEPPGFQRLSPDACDVAGVLRDLYG